MKENLASQTLVQSSGFATYVLPDDVSQEEQQAFIGKLALNKGALLYIDLRGSKRNLVDYARQRKIPVIVYDDIFEDGLVPNALINPTESDGHRYLQQGVEYLLGRRYIILDPRQSIYRKKTCSVVANKLFICFGGADPCNLTSRIAKLLLQNFPALQISIAIGPAFQHEEELQEVIKECGAKDKVCVYRGYNFLAPIMSQADAAITSGGTLMCEAIDLCIPVLALPTIEHEVDVVMTYSRESLVAAVSCDVNTIADDILKSAMEDFMSSQALRHKIFNAQMQAGNFNGGSEIVECVRRILESRNTTQAV